MVVIKMLFAVVVVQALETQLTHVLWQFTSRVVRRSWIWWRKTKAFVEIRPSGLHATAK